MDDEEFDRALVAAAFALAGRVGWRRMSVPRAAVEASLPLARARMRFPHRAAVLRRFGALADHAALTGVIAEGSVRDRLFDMLMRRYDALQAHRAGVIALLDHLPADPPLTICLALATRRSMRWMLESAGVSARGVGGELRARGLTVVWLWALRAWRSDHTDDLTGTMAALDSALRRAEQAASWFRLDRAVREDQAPESRKGEDSEPDLPSAPFDSPPEPPTSPPTVL